MAPLGLCRPTGRADAKSAPRWPTSLTGTPSLTAYAHNLARLGRKAESLEAVDKVEGLDPRGKLGAPRLPKYSAAHAAMPA